MRAKLPIKDGPPSDRSEHVEHFIETLDDRDLADQLTLLRVADADEMEETLRARQRAKTRQGKATMGSARFRPKAVPTPTPAASKPARAIHVLKAQGDSSGSDAEDSDADADGDLRKMYSAVAPNHPSDPRSRLTPDVSTPPRDPVLALRVSETRRSGVLEKTHVPEMWSQRASF